MVVLRAIDEKSTKWLKTMHGWEPKPEWVNTAHGLVAAIGTALRAFTNQSDGIIIFSPVYHQFRNIIKANRELIESEMIKKMEDTIST